MKRITVFLCILIMMGCIKHTCPIKDSVYHDISELKGLEGYIDYMGQIYGSYAIAEYARKGNHIVALEKVQNDTGGNVKYKLLDTISVHLDTLTQALVFNYCSIDSVNDPSLFSLSIYKPDSNGYMPVLKVWEIDTLKEEIRPYKNIKHVKCQVEVMDDEEDD